MTDLFDDQSVNPSHRPLAERMRSESITEFIGQVHVIGENTLLRNAVLNDKLFSMIFWGPPGCGKTTLARIMAHHTRAHFIQMSAVSSGVREIKAVAEAATDRHRLYHRRTLLFVDEIHRFNKAQQDAFLPHVENGLIILIGATTENPSFEVNAPLLSRLRVILLKPLNADDLSLIMDRAMSDREKGLGRLDLSMEPEARAFLLETADGDARVLLNHLEIIAAKTGDGVPMEKVTLADVQAAVQKTTYRYDKSGDSHYDLISALHKSLRGSDPDAALYWLGRMLAAGEDPLYIGRRMVRFATEDVGNADPYALSIAIEAVNAFRFLGSPEGDLALAQAAVYLAAAPKSNRVYEAYQQVQSVIAKTGSLPVPLHIRNAPTRLMKEMGYGEGYKYAHDYENAYTPQTYLPEALAGRRFYRPSDQGYERRILERQEKRRQTAKPQCP